MRLFAKKWVLTEDLGLAGLRILSTHRTRADAVLSIPDDPAGTYRVMRTDVVAWLNSEDSYRLVGKLADEYGDNL